MPRNFKKRIEKLEAVLLPQPITLMLTETEWTILKPLVRAVNEAGGMAKAIKILGAAKAEADKE